MAWRFHGVQRLLHLCVWTETAHRPVMCQQRRSEDCGGLSCDSRLSGSLQPGHNDQKRRLRQLSTGLVAH